jgi:hypothetical protein
MTAMASFVIFAASVLAVGTGKWEDILLESGRSEEAQDVEINMAQENVEIPYVQEEQMKV